MTRPHLLPIVAAFLIASPPLLGFMFDTCASGNDLVIIANKDVPADALTGQDLKNIFLGMIKEWSNSRKIMLATLKTGETHNHFLAAYIKKNPSQFVNYWKRMLFTGEGVPPKSFQNQDDLVKYIAATPGAIGYVSTVTSAEVNILPIN